MNSVGKLAGTLAAALVLGTSLQAFASADSMQPEAMANPMVGGMSMSAKKDIIDNAAVSNDNKTLVAAVKAAGLVDTLKGKGPFTVFAPTDEAFAVLPNGTVESLLKPENKGTLSKVLTYHVVAGKLDFVTLRSQITAGSGKAQLKTVNGETLIAMMNGDRNIVLQDSKGNIAHISTYDVYQSNGVIQIIDHVLMP